MREMMARKYDLGLNVRVETEGSVGLGLHYDTNGDIINQAEINGRRA
jgi:fructose-specific phosphotransferase system component IIB